MLCLKGYYIPLSMKHRFGVGPGDAVLLGADSTWELPRLYPEVL